MASRVKTPNRPRRDRLDTFALVLAVIAIAVLAAAAASAVNLANAPTPSPPTLGPAPTLSSGEATATHAAAAATSTKEHALAVTLAAVMHVTPGSVALGLSPAGTLPAPPNDPDFVAQNVWIGLIDGTWVSVYAGARKSDPQQGVLLLVSVTDERVDQQSFPVSLSHGALHITGQNVERLTVVAPDGTTYFFDVLARRFVGSLIAYAETATPLPSYTPSVTPSATATPSATLPPTPAPTATLGSPSTSTTTTPAPQ